LNATKEMNNDAKYKTSWEYHYDLIIYATVSLYVYYTFCATHYQK